MGIEDVDMRRGHSVIELRRQSLPLRQVTSAHQDLRFGGLPKLGRNDSPGCTVPTNNAESDGSTHCSTRGVRAIQPSLLDQELDRERIDNHRPTL